MKMPDWYIRRQRTKGGPRVDVQYRLDSKSFKDGDCIIWKGVVSRDGYGQIGIGRKSPHRVHQVAWELKYGKIPDGMLICHRCDRPLCINTDHLFLGTPRDNTRDCWAKGRNRKMPVGEKHHMAKLKDCQREEIRRLRKSGLPLMALAIRFGVSFQSISLICRKEQSA